MQQQRLVVLKQILQIIPPLPHPTSLLAAAAIGASATAASQSSQVAPTSNATQSRRQQDLHASFNLRKGQSGRILVVGGSEEYCGAPYYAGMASLKTGADICHVMCDPLASPVIKSFSPDLIVHPYITDSPTTVESALDLLSRIHLVIIGPGLSRTPRSLSFAKTLLAKAQSLHLPIVLDADALYLLETTPFLLQTASVSQHTPVIITPNQREFERLCETYIPTSQAHSATGLATALGFSVTAIKKGAKEVIASSLSSPPASSPTSNTPATASATATAPQANNILLNTSLGSPRRCGGQGDVLAGCLATFIVWAHNAAKSHPNSSTTDFIKPACLAATLTVRRASLLAYIKKGRAVTAVDVLAHVGQAFADLWDRDVAAGVDGDDQVEMAFRDVLDMYDVLEREEEAGDGEDAM